MTGVAPRKRIGVFTGGGDCPGLNAVIRAVVKSASVQGWEVLGFEDSTDGLLKGGRYRALTSSDVSGILDRGGTILGTSNQSNPFAFPTRNDNGAVRLIDRSQEVIETARDLRLDGLIAVGGNGTQAMSQRFFDRGLPMVGVPKTIDNDLSGTDVTFGYNTAVTVASDALDRLHSTAEAHHRVMILEVMGRHTGWIALEAGISGGADVILIPEIPFMLDRVVEKIRERVRNGRRFSIVVVAEGAYELGGNPIRQRDSRGMGGGRLGGVGNHIQRQLERRLNMETRCTVLGHLQRGGSPTPFDRVLATRFGIRATELIHEGRFGRMVALRGGSVTDVSLQEAIGHQKVVPITGELVRTARSTDICFGD